MNYHEKYLKYKAKYLKLKYQEKQLNNLIIQDGGANNKEKDTTLYLFKADWCPHCKQFKNTWSNLKKDFGTKVNFIMFDADKDASKIKEFNIEGYPTLILKSGEKAIEYVGPRNFESVKEFIDTYN